jgi:hypothetical protein
MQTPLITESDRKFYNDRISLTEQDGWLDLIEEFNNLEQLYNNLDSIESKKDLWFNKGQLSILRQILSLEETTKVAMEELGL